MRKLLCNDPSEFWPIYKDPKSVVVCFVKDHSIWLLVRCFDLTLMTQQEISTRVHLPHPEVFKALRPNASILVNDGKIRLKVMENSLNHATCKVVVGGEISDRKGVNLPDVVLPLSALSEKDRTDLEFVCGLGIDWLALSFVQVAEDVHEARVLVKDRAAILSKIEKPAAVKNYEAILKVSDGIMVARGDLGVELPVQEVPRVQKMLFMSASHAREASRE